MITPQTHHVGHAVFDELVVHAAAVGGVGAQHGVVADGVDQAGQSV